MGSTSRFSFAYSGLEEAKGFLDQAVDCTEKNDDGPGKAMMLGQVAAIRIKYEHGAMADEGRRLFREAAKLLQAKQSTAATVSLVSLYQAWAEAECRVENTGEAKAVTARMFETIDRLPVKQNIKNQYVADAAAAVLVEMALAADVNAKLPVPDVIRFKTTNGEWKSPTADDFENGLTAFNHETIERFEQPFDSQAVLANRISGESQVAPPPPAPPTH